MKLTWPDDPRDPRLVERLLVGASVWVVGVMVAAPAILPGPSRHSLPIVPRFILVLIGLIVNVVAAGVIVTLCFRHSFLTVRHVRDVGLWMREQDGPKIAGLASESSSRTLRSMARAELRRRERERAS